MARLCDTLTLIWVRGHSQCSQNNLADALANQGRLAPEIEADAPETPWSLVKEDLTKKVNAYWSWAWRMQDTCRQSKHFFPKADHIKSFKIVMLNRNQWAKVIGLTSGHNALRRHLFLCADPEDLETDPPTCDLCEEGDQTSAHYIGECPALAQLRWNVFGHPFLKPTFEDLPYIANPNFYYSGDKEQIQAYAKLLRYM